jgi:hypothetical protein
MLDTAVSIPDLPCQLPAGLILRRSAPADADALAEFNVRIHTDPGREPEEEVGFWVRDLLSGTHPTHDPDDFLIVEERATGKIVSSLNLISQTWSYDGIPFGVGRPELVGTEPEYRRQGLVRRQFDIVHAWSAERGELVQAITGIPYYYRQFGYEMTMYLGGSRAGHRTNVPQLRDGEAEPYRLRPATEDDLPFVMAVDAYASRRSLVACVRDETIWRYELFGKNPRNIQCGQWRVIESAAGEPVGVLAHPHYLWGQGTRLGIVYLELKESVSWLSVTPSLLRGMLAVGSEIAVAQGKTLEWLDFNLGGEHPFYQVTQDRLPVEHKPYAWYIRVPDLPAFMQRIAPALERRLADSIAVGHTGELKLSFYRTGLRLVFEHGRITTVENWQPRHEDGGHAAFPGLTFLQLLFGHRTWDELRGAFVDCWADGDDVRALLRILFPRQASTFWPVA